MNIPAAKPSPRISNGVIYFYQGDTFELVLTLNLYGDNDAQYIIASDDTVTVNFYDDTDELVDSQTFSNIEDNKITLDFDSATTAKFGKGKYYYHVVLNSDSKTTIVAKNRLVTEDKYE